MKIVCLGDSFTAGLRAPKGKSWFELLRESIKDQGIELINKGISGDTTSGMLARFRTDVTALKPKYVIMAGGLNNIFVAGRTGMEIAMNDYMSLAHMAVHDGIIPIIGIEPRVDPDNINPLWMDLPGVKGFNQDQEEFLDRLRQFAGAFGFFYLDFDAAFLEWRDGRRPEPLYVDGLHLVQEGHAAMYQKAKSVLEEIII